MVFLCPVYIQNPRITNDSLSQLDPCWTCFRTEIDFEFKKMSPERGGEISVHRRRRRRSFSGELE